jgi:hypothetical protein
VGLHWVGFTVFCRAEELISLVVRPSFWRDVRGGRVQTCWLYVAMSVLYTAYTLDVFSRDGVGKSDPVVLRVLCALVISHCPHHCR